MSYPQVPDNTGLDDDLQREYAEAAGQPGLTIHYPATLEAQEVDRRPVDGALSALAHACATIAWVLALVLVLASPALLIALWQALL